MRPALSSCFTLALLLAAPAARADPIDACLRAADEGQTLRDRGQLLAARDRFAACAAAACPSIVRADCAGWLSAVDQRIPSVLFRAVDGEGRPLADVRVSIDGAPPEPLSDKERRLDPGEHRLRFFAGAEGSPALEQTLVLRERERAQTHIVRLLPPPAVPPPPRPPEGMARGAVIASIVLGGAAVAGGAVFAGLAWDAKHGADDLRATCAPGCSPAAVDAVRAKEIGANVALGVGAACAAAALIVLLVRPRAAPSLSRAEPALVVRF